MGCGIFWFLAGAGAATWWSKHESARACHWQRDAWHRQHYGARGVYPQQQYANHDPAPPLNAAVAEHGPQQHPQHSSPQHFAAAHPDAWAVDRARWVDSMADLSESSLDALLVTVQAMRNRLAESRARRPEHAPPMQQTPSFISPQQSRGSFAQNAGDADDMTPVKPQ